MEEEIKPKKRKPRMNVFERAVFMLGRRGYAEKEMYKALVTKGFDEDIAAEAVARLLEYNYMNDRDFAYERIRTRALLSKWGKRRIHTELKNKGVPEQLIIEGFERFEEGSDERLNETFNWQAEATELLLRKYGEWPATIKEAIDKAQGWDEKQVALKESQKQQAKRINFLLRRGFSSEQAIKAFEAVKQL
ncbi:MAG: regulatory protein [Alphaproteobacteria bacterium]|jgi:regulatory protein